METLKIALLSVAAFGLGAVPFSIIIGRLFLRDDIRDYGDGNPGAFNVFRAGGQKTGYLAIFLDVAKGVPFVFLAHSVFGLSGVTLVVVGMCAILGHAFSPFLRWHGGKAIAVTFGVLLALPEHEMLLAFIACMVVGALFIEVDAWTAVFGAGGTLAYIALTRGSSWETLLMLGILVVFTVKQFHSLRVFPGFRGRLVRWLQSIIRGTLTII